MTDTLEEQIAAEMSPDDEHADEEEAPPEHEPEPEPEDAAQVAPLEDAQAPTDVEMEKRYKGAERAFTTYTKRISELWGDDAPNLVPFGLSPSAPPGFIDPRDAGRVDEGTKATILEFLGFAREQDYERDPTTETCRVCAGKGDVDTGSKVERNRLRECSNCHGYGYYPPPALGEVVAAANGSTHVPASAVVAPLAEPDVDTTGEPRILPDGRPNPNYGKWPQYKIRVEPWGVTAGLTAQDAA